MEQQNQARQASPDAPAVPCSALRARRLRGKFHLGFVTVGCILAGLVGWKLVYIFFLGNVHTVIPGRIYRGAQPSPADLANLVERHGIRTVINLRGCCNPFDWYLEQCRAVVQLDLDQIDLRFSAGRLPSVHELRRLVEALDQADPPVFFHCRRGADRTGLAAAIAVLLLTDASLEEGLAQLGLTYGHVALGRPATLDAFFDLYSRWLKDQRLAHHRDHLRRWLLHEYDGGWCSARFEIFEPVDGPPRAGRPCAFRVRVRNTGVRAWELQPNSKAGFHLGFTVWDERDARVTGGRAGLLETSVPPGEAIELTLVLPPLPRPGRYRLLADMVEEQHCWFFQTGTEPHEEEIAVRE